jgi:hypothetical protein
MWARVVEVTLGCWLVISPFIFRHPTDATFLWINDVATGAIVITIALVSIWPRLEKLHFLQLAVAAYLVLVAFLAAPPPPPAPHQNHVTLALLLIILAIIPTRGTRPPRSWEVFYEERRQAGKSV